MVEDALDGKIDLIITKSVSRFARNTVDSLSTIRKLKEHGTECYFEKENIWTFDSKGELLITIMSSLAQEESRSISENVTWGVRRRFQSGKCSVAYSQFLGYDKDWVVNEEQAKTVRKIYKYFLAGLSPAAIARELEKEGIKAPAGGNRWHGEIVRNILLNEKYKGDCLLQKKYTQDFLTKKQVVNHGEVPQYYVEDHHQPIVSAETFELVQHEMERRKRAGRKYSGVSVFSSKLVCGECGGFYGSKVWHSNSKYRKVIWQCNAKFKDKTGCGTPHLTDDEIRQKFVQAVNKLLSDKEAVLADIEILRQTAEDTAGLQGRLDAIYAEMEEVNGQMDDLIGKNSRHALDQEVYNREFDELDARYKAKKAEYEELADEMEKARAAVDIINDFKAKLDKIGDAVTEFDINLWGGMMETATVQTDGKLVFRFKVGVEITV
ncbi:MAG: hypothetical protein BACD_00106 [Bacteroides rodentium]